jgi:formylglycine-generating enzyme required for sulfatase activity
MFIATLTFALAAIPALVGTIQEPSAGTVRTDSKGIELVYVPPGQFTMGSNKYTAEHPVRKVTVSGFWIGKNLVTVAQFRQFTVSKGYKFDWNTNEPTWGWVDNNPIVNVTWDDARAFCRWAGGDLPTEAQWEKAARGTDGREFPWGNEFSGRNLWWSRNHLVGGAGSTMAVGSFPRGASPYGCLDMAGNVWEWCLDWFRAEGYDASKATDPMGPESGKYRVLRGGSWMSRYAGFFRCACRRINEPSKRRDSVGFRIVAK